MENFSTWKSAQAHLTRRLSRNRLLRKVREKILNRDAFFVLCCTVLSSFFLLGSASQSTSISVPGAEFSLQLAQNVCTKFRRNINVDLMAIANAIAEASLKYDVRPELLFAMMAEESGCRIDARSSKGAVGLMQLMPATARDMGILDPSPLRQNIFGGAKYMALLLKTFDGDLATAVAAYNAGPEAVRRHKGKIPPFKETQRYVKRVLKGYSTLRAQQA